ncbi:pitrilysin family protein [Paraflavitalea speifideaquila]|uniref:M16 family metallopeptidase n=1 Tax=Paraflavitalea speifideaquila TaxID=3076558 RepID=UPI0028EDEB24|nr:pitrilysin family protein [Paraflavitalea speifideiaquila]
MLNRTIAPEIKEPVDFKIALPGCQKHTLSNGIEVYTVDMGSEETLMVNWVFYAGNWYEDSKALAAATNFLLKNGTSKKSAFDINEHFEYYGAYVSRSCYNETSEITLHCLNKHTNELLPTVAELITDAVFPAEELTIYKQNAKQRLQVSLQKCEFVAGRLIDAYLFGEKHPYGKYNNAEDYDTLQREDIVAYYNKYYRNGRCVIFAAGKLPADLLSQLEKHFGSLPLQSHRQELSKVQHILEPAPEKKKHIINDPNGVQAAIRIARPFPNRHHPDFQKTLVLNTLFGGFFGSRLMGNIREDKGYTYGIYSYLLNYINDSGWLISTEAGRDVSEATITEVYNEMELMREEPVDEEELLMTRNYMIGSILGDLDGPFQVIGRWKTWFLII